MIWELERGAVLFGEEHVLVLAAVEGRVEVDEVDGFVLDVLARDFEVVAVIELVFLHRGKILARIGRLRNCSSVCVVETPIWHSSCLKQTRGPSTRSWSASRPSYYARDDRVGVDSLLIQLLRSQ